MKKIFLFLIFIFVFCQIGLAQRPHASYYLWEVDSSSATWQIVGTERDTSEWYRSFPTMTFYFWPRDTTTGANGDSVALTIYYQSSPNKDRALTSTDTLSIVTANDSVMVPWRKTEVPTNSGAYYRIIIAGEAGNDKDAGSLIDPQFDGYPVK